LIIQGTHPFMDGHLMFPIYGTLIIVIIYRISLISHMKKNQHIFQFLSLGVAPPKFTTTQKKKLVVKAPYYQLIVGNCYKLGEDDILQRCVLEHKRPIILSESHEGIVGVHYARKEKAQNIFHIGIWWLTLHKDAKEFYQNCDVCERVRNPSKRYEMSLVLQVTL
jgi:hypothetical protein